MILQRPLKHARFSAIYLELMTTYEALSSADESEFQTLEPKILYFGTPIALISSVNPDGTPNLAPMSSFWVLGWTLVLGISLESQTIENLRQRPDCVVNLPSPDLWRHVERLAPLTGRNPVPGDKESRFRFERDKFGASGLTPLASEGVRAAGERVSRAVGGQGEAHLSACWRPQIAGCRRGSRSRGRDRARAPCPPLCIGRERDVNPRSWQPLILQLPPLFRSGPGIGQDLPRRNLIQEMNVITVCIRYTIDISKLSDFEKYARNWSEPIPRCGGEKLLGYFLPTKLSAGATNVAYALINFTNLAAYEKYREALMNDEDAMQNFAFADRSGCIQIEDRSILRRVP